MDTTRVLTAILTTLPKRIADVEMSESMLAEAIDLFSVDALLKRPDSQSAIAEIREAICYAFARKLREGGIEYETISTGLYACSRCHATPILAVVIQPSPAIVAFQCPNCSYEERKNVAEHELSEIRLEGSPVNWKSKGIAKRRSRKRDQINTEVFADGISDPRGAGDGQGKG